MVDFAFTEAQQEFARGAHVCARRVVPKVCALGSHWRVSHRTVAKMGQLGVTGICIPDAYGGQEADCARRGSPPRRSPAAILTAGTPDRKLPQWGNSATRHEMVKGRWLAGDGSW